MDLTIPYTFYPLALPGWVAWLLFLTAVLGGAGIGILRGRRWGWMSGVAAGAGGVAVLLMASILLSMVITFFAHGI